MATLSRDVSRMRETFANVGPNPCDVDGIRAEERDLGATVDVLRLTLRATQHCRATAVVRTLDALRPSPEALSHVDSPRRAFAYLRDSLVIGGDDRKGHSAVHVH